MHMAKYRPNLGVVWSRIVAQPHCPALAFWAHRHMPITNSVEVLARRLVAGSVLLDPMQKPSSHELAVASQHKDGLLSRQETH